MTKISILGANRGLARNTTRFLLDRSDVELTLCLRTATPFGFPTPTRHASGSSKATSSTPRLYARRCADGTSSMRTSPAAWRRRRDRSSPRCTTPACGD
nr:hypothetical protein [Siculibacillus lacustris]